MEHRLELERRIEGKPVLEVTKRAPAAVAAVLGLGLLAGGTAALWHGSAPLGVALLIAGVPLVWLGRFLSGQGLWLTETGVYITRGRGIAATREVVDSAAWHELSAVRYVVEHSENQDAQRRTAHYLIFDRTAGTDRLCYLTGFPPRRATREAIRRSCEAHGVRCDMTPDVRNV